MDKSSDGLPMSWSNCRLMKRVLRYLNTRQLNKGNLNARQLWFTARQLPFLPSTPSIIYCQTPNSALSSKFVPHPHITNARTPPPPRTRSEFTSECGWPPAGLQVGGWPHLTFIVSSTLFFCWRSRNASHLILWYSKPAIVERLHKQGHAIIWIHRSIAKLSPKSKYVVGLMISFRLRAGKRYMMAIGVQGTKVGVHNISE